MLSASIKKTSTTSDEGNIAKAGKHRIANLKLLFFLQSSFIPISLTFRNTTLCQMKIAIRNCCTWKC